MSGTTTPILRSPNEASQIFGGAGVPRQRHVFLVRFRAPTAFNLYGTSLVVKHCDRPRITPKVEELNQYNKKRVIYTGYKYEPVKITFYDSADGAAQNLWKQYARYYFGDLNIDANVSYGYDITTQQFNAGSAGLSEEYKGHKDNASQWFFDHIEIFHFYYINGQHSYDSYFLYHPRISSYEPDDLDYENSNVSQVTMSFVYENLQYNSGAVSAGDFPEFVRGGGFFGNPLLVTSDITSGNGAPTDLPQQPVNPPVSNLLVNLASASPTAAPYRLISDISSGALSNFGNYQYGGATVPTLASTAVNSGLLNNITGGVSASLNSVYGTAANTLTSALLGTAGGLTSGVSGTSLPSAAYGLINAQQTGTAQYGVNAASTSSSLAWMDYFNSNPNPTVDFALPVL